MPTIEDTLFGYEDQAAWEDELRRIVDNDGNLSSELDDFLHEKFPPELVRLFNERFGPVLSQEWQDVRRYINAALKNSCPTCRRGTN